jgi:hypothetical protein
MARLQAGYFGIQIPAGARETFLFSQNVHTGSRAYLDSYLRDTRGTFPRYKPTIARG